MLQCVVAVCCSVLQCVAVCRSVLQYVVLPGVSFPSRRNPLRRRCPRGVGSCVLQCVAVCCSVLQYVAVRCATSGVISFEAQSIASSMTSGSWLLFVSNSNIIVATAPKPVYMCMYIDTYTYTCMYVCMYMVCIYTNICVYIYTDIYMCTFIRI